MLLSMILSYYLSGSLSRGIYVLSMAFFIILASALSTFLGYFWILLFYYPLWLLSFPFVSIVEQVHSWTPITAYNIGLLTLEIVSFSPENATFYAFLFFLLVNVLGAILGYWFNKTLAHASLKRELFDFFFQSGFLSFLVCYILWWPTFFLTSGRFNPIDNPLEYAIVNAIFFFLVYLFWIPALIATVIYGICER